MSELRLADYGGWRAALWRQAVGLRRRLWGMPTAARRALPDFVLIGAQRSGTTSLYEFLRGHADVRWPPLVKSPHWFDTNYTASRRWYRSHFPLAPSGRDWVTGEASPYYLHHPYVPQRIATYLPDTRLVAVLRDPVARAWSAYQHERDRGYEGLSFRDALEAEEARIAPELPRLADPAFVGHHHRHHAYVGRGLYADQLRRYHAHFDPDQLLVLTLDELKANPQASFDRLCDFLGVGRAPVPSVTRHNARVYEPMDPDDREWLAARFAAPNRELERLLGHAVPW